MTREEAIKWLDGIEDKYIHGGDDDFDAKRKQALDMAIEALKREPQKKYPTEWCEQCTLWENNKCVGVAQCKRNIEALKPLMNDDLISRAEAIEAIELVDWYHQNSNKDMVHGANDDEHQAWYKAQDIYKALEAVPSANRPTDGDLISRAEAIDALRYAQHRFTVADEAGGMGSVKWSEDVIYFAAAERVLTELPSADRPKGEWNDIGGVIKWGCSLCHYAYDQKFNFCPNCGADMRGERE